MKELSTIITLKEYKNACQNYKGSELLTHSGGIYFIYGLNKELIYIGYTGRYAARISAHVNTSVFKKEIYAFRFLSTEHFDIFWNKHPEAVNIEYFYIKLYKPKYNKRGV